MKKSMSLIAAVLISCYTTVCGAQTQLQFDGGFNVVDEGGIAYLQNTGNLAIVDTQGGNDGPIRLHIYTTGGTFVVTIPISNAGLGNGEFFLNDGVTDLPNGNLVVVTNLGNVFEISPVTAAIVPGGYGGFNVFAAMGSPDPDPRGIAYQPSTTDLWVADDNGVPNDTITQIDTAGNAVFGPFFALVGDVNGIGFAPNYQTLFAIDDNNQMLVEMTLLGQFLQTIDIAALTAGSGLTVDPQDIATDAVGGRIFITNKTANAGNVMVFSVVNQETDIAVEQFNVFRGIQIAGTLADINQSDDAYLKVNPGITLNSNEPPVWIEFQGTLPTDNPTSLSTTLEAKRKHAESVANDGNV